MKFPIYSIAIPILAAVAFAQDPPGQGSATAGAQPSDKTVSKSTDRAPDKSMDRAPEMKTQTYAGTLVDASCAGAGAGSPAATSTSSTTPAGSSGGSADATSPTNPTSSSAERTGSADRAAGSSAARTAGSGGQACALSSGATQFALQMKDGQTVRFDDVGNARAVEAMSSHKKWSDSVTANKPLSVKVSAVMSGDKLTVMSIH